MSLLSHRLVVRVPPPLIRSVGRAREVRDHVREALPVLRLPFLGVGMREDAPGVGVIGVSSPNVHGDCEVPPVALSFARRVERLPVLLRGGADVGFAEAGVHLPLPLLLLRKVLDEDPF